MERATFRYKSLREKFRRETLILSREYKSGISPSGREEWPLYEAMKFLERQIRPRKTASNIHVNEIEEVMTVSQTQSSLDTVDFDEDQALDNQYEDLLLLPAAGCSNVPEVNISPVSAAMSMATPRQKAKRKQADISNDVSSILTRLTDVAEKSVQEKGTTSDYHHFGQYVSETLKKLPDREADLAIEDIMSVLLTAKRKCRGEAT